jgi:ubiquinone/menaquinone biosynthesis C-methylase UbiE
MDPSLQRRVQRYGWDKASAYYEASWQNQLKPAQDLLLEMADLQPGECVLDTACGTGLVSFRALQKLGGNGRVTGTDISEKMVALANSIALEKRNPAFILKGWIQRIFSWKIIHLMFPFAHSD